MKREAMNKSNHEPLTKPGFSEKISVPPSFEVITPERVYTPIPEEKDIAKTLKNGYSAVVVGDSGIGKTACCKAALSRINDEYYCFRLLHPPKSYEIPKLIEWSTTSTRRTIIMLDEEKSNKDRNYSAIRKIFLEGRDWLNTDRIAVVIAVQPDTYKKLQEEYALDVLSHFREIHPRGFDHQNAQRCLQAYLKKPLDDIHKKAMQTIFDAWSDSGYVLPIQIIGLYNYLRTSSSHDNILAGVKRYLSSTLVRYLPDEEKKLWVIHRNINSFAVTCPESALCYIARKQGLEEPECSIDSMVSNGLLRLEQHPVYLRAYSIHDLYHETEDEQNEIRHKSMEDTVELLLSQMEEIAYKIKEKVKKVESISVQDMRQFISACYMVLESTPHTPLFDELLYKEGCSYPCLSRPRSARVEQKLQMAVDEMFNTFLATVSDSQSKEYFTELCRGFSGYLDFYQHFNKEEMRLNRSSVNAAHEVGLAIRRQLSKKMTVNISKEDRQNAKEIAERKLVNAADGYEYCAGNLSGTIDSFEEGLLWRAAGWDYMHAEDYGKAQRCFNEAADDFLKDRNTWLLAAQCYRGWGITTQLNSLSGLRGLLKSIYLRYVEQFGLSFMNWEEQINTFFPEFAKSKIEAEWEKITVELKENSFHESISFFIASYSILLLNCFRCVLRQSVSIHNCPNAAGVIYASELCGR